jgi:hypothetical protein
MQTRSRLSIALLALCAATGNFKTNSAQPPASATPPAVNPNPTAPAVAQAPDPVEAPARNLQDLLNQYSDLYNSESPADQLSLARILYKASANAENHTEQFAMLSAARDAAARAGDYTAAWKLCDVAVEKFNVSPGEMRTGLFKAGWVSLNRPGNLDAYIANLTKAIDQALLADEFKPARELIQLGRTAPASGPNWDSLLDARQARLDTQAQAYAAIKPAIDTLQRTPGEPQSNLAVGQYDCFVKGDWHTGLTLLSRGGDADLRQLAVLDLREPKETEKQLAIAKGWNDVSITHPAIGSGARLRAYDWYLRALPLATIDAQRSEAESQITALMPSVAAERPNAAMWLAIGDSLSHRAYAPTPVAGGTRATESFDQNFQDLPGNGGLLVGFHYALARLGNKEVITSLQPIYLTPAGETDGVAYGHAYSPVQTWHAPDGYAIGAARVCGGVTINSLTLTAMRIDSDRLNPDDARNSPRIGGAGGTLEIFNGHGTPVIGICGRQRDGFLGLGLVYSQAVKDE